MHRWILLAVALGLAGCVTESEPLDTLEVGPEYVVTQHNQRQEAVAPQESIEELMAETLVHDDFGPEPTFDHHEQTFYLFEPKKNVGFEIKPPNGSRCGHRSESLLEFPRT